MKNKKIKKIHIDGDIWTYVLDSPVVNSTCIRGEIRIYNSNRKMWRVSAEELVNSESVKSQILSVYFFAPSVIKAYIENVILKKNSK